MGTINYEEACHKALTYANASNFVTQELIFVNVHQENDKCFFSNKSQKRPIITKVTPKFETFSNFFHE